LGITNVRSIPCKQHYNLGYNAAYVVSMLITHLYYYIRLLGLQNIAMIMASFLTTGAALWVLSCAYYGAIAE